MFTYQDYVLNNGGGPVGYGEVGQFLESARFDSGLLRPFFNDFDGLRPSCVVTNSKGQKEIARISDLMAAGINSPVFNSTSLRKEEWINIDQKVLLAARYELRAWQDLAAANSLGGFDGMGTTILEHETMSDPGEALVDMDALADSRSDEPIYTLQGLPLPITHCGFTLSARKLAASRKKGMPLNVTMAGVAGRRVAESIEKTTIGTNTGITYGGTNTAGTYGRTSQVYGYTNFTPRITSATLRNPSAYPSYTPAMTLADVLGLLDLAKANKFKGPFMLYTSNDWDRYLDTDYILSGGNVATQTLRNRLRAIDGITDVRRLDFMFGTAVTGTTYNADSYDNLNPFTMVLVQMTDNVAEAVTGMDLTTIQWESRGGMQLNFKVMAIMAPRLKADYYGRCGIVHATSISS